jgi:hypothetical protein
VVEIHESVCRPELFLKFLASYDLAGMLKQHRQDLEGLFLKPDSYAMLAQLTSGEIQFENSKMERPAQLTVFLHEEANLSGKGVYHRTELDETQGGDTFR